MQPTTANAASPLMSDTETKVPALPPLLDPTIATLLEHSPGRVMELVEQFGSPLNIVWPHILHKNLHAMRSVLQAHGVEHQIFYAAKVNKSQSLVRAAVDAGLGVDASSLYEFRDALRAGAKPEQICGTGPAKPDAFIADLVSRGALISIDSVEELAVLESLLSDYRDNWPIRVTLRYRPSASLQSRFGMTANDLEHCLRKLSTQKAALQFEGFHFHLGGYRPAPRAEALCELVDWVDTARALGLSPKMVDIGGGIPIRYVDSDSYDAFIASHHDGHYRNATTPTSFYPYGGRMDAQKWLSLFLASPCRDGQNIADYLKQENLVLGLEPGRSLVDQTAVTAFRITRVKALGENDYVLFVEGSSFSACETWFNSEFLQDPIHLPCGLAGANDDKPCRAYIAGHSCLDEDVITNRFLPFQSRPQTGDLIVYANTAGYQMDLLENEFHRVPMPNRIAVNSDLTTVVLDDLSGEAE